VPEETIFHQPLQQLFTVLRDSRAQKSFHKAPQWTLTPQVGSHSRHGTLLPVIMSADAPPSDPLDQLIVDFPTASLRPTPTVRFASSPTVLPIRSASATITQQDDLWYSRTDRATMRQQMRSDAATLRRTLLTPPPAEVLENGGVHVSQAVGLEKILLDPTEARSK
jgi:hypothetical protein